MKLQLHEKEETDSLTDTATLWWVFKDDGFAVNEDDTIADTKALMPSGWYMVTDAEW